MSPVAPHLPPSPAIAKLNRVIDDMRADAARLRHPAPALLSSAQFLRNR